MKKVLLGLLALIIIAIIGFTAFVNLSWEKDFSDSYPVNDNIQISSDSASIARGKYLVYGAAHCAHCHVPFDQLGEVESGIEVPLIGGMGLEIPPGKFFAPNITPDPETGIGNKSNGEIYRMLRHNIRPNGMAAIEFMPFINMTEEDILAIMAYLRSAKPVKSEILNTEYSFIGKALLALEVIKPGVPDKPVPISVNIEATPEYGQYLASSVANCRGCHTSRDMKTGEYIGEYYAGGLVFEDNLSNGWKFISPNLTDDPETGHMSKWTEETFVQRMKAGRVFDYSPMPWAAYASMDEIELKAIYRYLKTLDPVANKVETTATAPINE